MENEIKGLHLLIEAIKSDYIKYKERSLRSMGREFDPETNSQVKEFCGNIGFKIGRNYIKILHGGAVWGFVVNSDNDKMFKRGDILKAAGWASPARNRARGNVIERNFSWVQWTGPAYIS